MASKRLKTLLVCSLSIMLCAAAVAVGTFALFSDTVTVKNHLQAGTLKTTLTRINLEKTELQANGSLATTTDTAAKPFTHETTETANIFDLEDGSILVPGCAYDAVMKIENKGTVAFDYAVNIVLTAPSTGSCSEAFARQLKITTGTVSADGATRTTKKTMTLLEAGSEPVFDGYIAAGTASAESFFVKIEFVNDATGDTNNAAQSGDVRFDLVVTATQKTEASTTGN